MAVGDRAPPAGVEDVLELMTRSISRYAVRLKASRGRRRAGRWPGWARRARLWQRDARPAPRRGAPGRTVSQARTLLGWMSIGPLGPERGDGLGTWGLPSTRKGASVARTRPTASDVPQIPVDLEAPRPVRGQPDGADGLSHAQARARRRCTPLTSAEFSARGQIRGVYGAAPDVDLASRHGLPAGSGGQRRLGIAWLRGGGNRADG